MSGNPSYDPFAYGSVRLGQGGKQGRAPADSPDDILFGDDAPGQGGGSAPRPKNAFTTEADTSWDPMDPDIGVPAAMQGMSETDIGADILGEGAAPPRSQPPKRAAAPAPAPAPMQAPAPIAAPVVAPPRIQKPKTDPDDKWAEAVTAGSTRPAPGAVVKPAAGLRKQPVRQRNPLSIVAASVIVSAAFAGSAWLYVVDKNPVMAAIAAAVGLVAAAFAWVSLRP